MVKLSCIKLLRFVLPALLCITIFQQASAQHSVNKQAKITISRPGATTPQHTFAYTQGGSRVAFSITTSDSFNGVGFWNFGDPASQQLNYSFNREDIHVYNKVGRFFISCRLSDPETNITDTILYDTIEVTGIVPLIESRLDGVRIASEHKNQVYAADTVDFVNSSRSYAAGAIKSVWDFDDRFAPQCTAYSVPLPGAVLPFTDAVLQYANSTHYYIYNGVINSGKMNCRWSLDSLPRHKYTNWDSVYSWLIHGKTFPANWNLPSIAANTPFTITPQTPVPDPYWLQQGRLVNLTSGTFQNRYDSITINDPILGTYKRYANATLPNSSMTFHEFVFRYLYTSSTKVKLNAVENNNVVAYDSLMMSLGKPLAYGLSIGGNIGRGPFNPSSSFGKYVEFGFHQTNLAPGTLPYGQSDVLFNFDSLADRLDNTPCELDGFINYAGGQTNGGLNFPGFSTQPDWTPSGWWQDGTYPEIIYHYGPNTTIPWVSNLPADSNGVITIGVTIANGVGNDKIWSDTVWYRQGVQVGPVYTASFASGIQECVYRPVGTTVNMNSDVKFLRDVLADLWNWGDGTYTIDSFWNAGADVSNAFYTHGLRRVRYHYDESGLIDSLVNPMGFAPGTAGKFYTSLFASGNLCGGNPVTSYYYTVDSAFMLGPVSHTYRKASAGMPGQITRLLSTRQQFVYVYGPTLAIGKSVNVSFQPSRFNDTIFCRGDEVSFIDSVKYFRRDCSVSDVFFNPNVNEYGQVLDAPYNGFHFDTANYWSRHSGRANDVKRTYVNQQTGTTDTIYYEKLFWDFNSDGVVDATGTKPKYRFSTTGSHRVSMICRDSLGFFDTAYCSVYVSEHKGGFTWEKYRCDRQVLFTDTTAARAQTYWKFMDSYPYLRLDTPSWVTMYNQPGNYRVTMISVNGMGCRDTLEKEITVNGLDPDFTIISDTAGCVPFTVTIVLHPRDTVSHASTTILWHDSANTQTLAAHGFDTLSFIYMHAGTYPIQVMRNDTLPDSCEQISLQQWVSAYEMPAIKISGDTAPLQGSTYLYVSDGPAVLPHHWTVSAATIISQDSNSILLRWDSTGNYQLIATVGLDSGSCRSADTLAVEVMGLTGTNEHLLAQSVRIYPNPANEHVTITFDQKMQGNAQLTIYDMLGKVKYTTEPKSADTVIDTSEWARGVYFVRLSLNNIQVTRKVVVE